MLVYIYYYVNAPIYLFCNPGSVTPQHGLILMLYCFAMTL